MDTSIVAPVLVRWMHVLTAIVAVGGLVFMAFVLRPAAARSLDAGNTEALRGAVMGRWRVVVMISIALLFVSGMATFLMESIDKGRAVPAYHAIFGVKFLLALVVFFFASVLAGRSRAFDKLRGDGARLSAITAALALAVAMIASILRSLG